MNQPVTPSGSVSIRPLSEADIDAVLALEQASDSAPHWSRADYLACLHDPGGSAVQRFGLVAEQHGAVAGFGIVRLLTVPDGVEAELESILVAPNLRGHGIGAALLDDLIQIAATHGARKFELEVRASNNSAVRLYRRAGLLEIGRRRNYYSHPEEDAVLMGRNL